MTLENLGVGTSYFGRLVVVNGIGRTSGETKTVSFRLKKKQFMQFGEDGGMTLAKGDHVVFVGGGQPGFADNAVSAKVIP